MCFVLKEGRNIGNIQPGKEEDMSHFFPVNTNSKVLVKLIGSEKIAAFICSYSFSYTVSEEHLWEKESLSNAAPGSTVVSISSTFVLSSPMWNQEPVP